MKIILPLILISLSVHAQSLLDQYKAEGSLLLNDDVTLGVASGEFQSNSISSALVANPMLASNNHLPVQSAELRLYKVDDLEAFDRFDAISVSPEATEQIKNNEVHPSGVPDLDRSCNNLLLLSLANEEKINQITLLRQEGLSSATNPNLNLLSRTLKSMMNENFMTTIEFPGLDKIKTDSNLQNAFKGICRTHLFRDQSAVGYDIAKEANHSELNDYLELGGLGGLGGSAGLRDSLNTGANGERCVHSNECSWKTEGVHTSCNMFSCSVEGEQFSASKSFDEIASRILLTNSEFKEKGDKNFCDNCFKEAAESQEDFVEKKKEREDDLAEIMIRKHSVIDLYALSEVFESITDMKTLQNDTEYQVYGCTEEIDKIKSYKCNKSNGNQEDYNKRLNKVLAEFGLSSKSSAQEISDLFKNKALKDGENQCSRDDFALYKESQWMNSDNKKTRDALSILFDDLLADEEAQDDLKEYCENDNHTLSVNSIINKNISARLGRELEKDIELLREINSTNESKESLQILCEKTKNSYISSIICGDDSDPRFAYFHHSLNLEEMSNALGLSTTSNTMFLTSIIVAGVGPITNSSITKLDKAKELQNHLFLLLDRKVEKLLNVSSKYSANIKSNLVNRDAFCKSFTKSKNENKPLANVISQNNSKISEYNKSLCKNLLKKMTLNMCGKASNLNQRYTKADRENALAELRQTTADEDIDKLATNSIACNINSSRDKRDSNEYIKYTPTDILAKGLQATPDAQLYDANPEVYDDPKQLTQSSRNDFNTFIRDERRTCDENWNKVQKDILNEQYGYDRFDVDIDYNIRDDITSKEVVINKYDNKKNEVVNNFIKNDIIPNIQNLSPENLKAKKGKLLSETIMQNIDQMDSSVKSKMAKSVNSFKDKINQLNKTQDQNFESDTNKYTTAQHSSKFKKEDYLQSDGAVIGQTQTPKTKLSELNGALNGASAGNNSFTDRQIASTSAVDACDEVCLARLREKIINKGSNSTPLENSSEAITAGLNPQGLSDSVLEEFTNVMRGNDNSEQLEEIQSSYQSLLEKTQDIERQFVEAPKSVQEENVPLSFNNDFVFDARNTTEPKFYPREEIAAKAADFAPSYVAEETPKKMSFIDYQSERRKSNNSFGSVQKEINKQIDTTFLSSQSFDSIDDLYIDAYIDHVDKSNGSIDHLVIFEDGEPTKIRVPDPKNAGQYILKSIPQSLKEKVLSQVQKDEVNSFTLYSMISFEQSLNDFITQIEAENENIVSLGGLNQILDQIDIQAQ